MKNFLITSLILSALIGCQTPTAIRKQTELVNNPIPATPPATPIEAQTLIESLNKCQLQQDCKMALNSQFNSWLLENNYITAAEQVETDEHTAESMTKNVSQTQLPETQKVNLSQVYMNNQLIKGAINEWLTWKRPQLIETWQYYQFLKPDMLPAFQQYGIEESLLLAIMAQESGGKVHSRSRMGAGGLFQIMPATAARLGLAGKDGEYDLRYNPKQSAKAAAKYIDEQLQLYAGDEAKLLAAYNSGENRFARLNRKYKNTSIWDKNFYYELPNETRHYIPVVIAAMLIFQDPEKFNVRFDALEAEIVPVQLAAETSLSELAICLGQQQRETGWFRVLRNINSGIKAEKTIAANTEFYIPKILLATFEQNCHNQELMALAQSFHDADFQATQGLFSYKVKSGDSLNSIVRKFKCTSKEEIASINQLKAPNYLIRAGKHLSIPQC